MSQTPKPTKTAASDIDSLRQRMVRELEQFLAKMVNRPFPRRQLKPAPASRYSVSMN